MRAYTSKLNMAVLSVVAPLALSACVSQSAYDSLQTQNQQLQTQNQQLQQQLSDATAHVERLRAAIKYTVNSDLLFPSGGWTMSAQGQSIIAKLAPKLAPTQQDKLYVNGYTDNTPIGATLMQKGVTTNQQLSEKRADAVMNFLISQGVKPDLVEAKGYGDANPVASNSTASGRAQNRRVELTLSPE
ncbi:MAG TPA: OmpA family protein [Acidocella sp.]|nr:OmpA family protein [Acidocella sp.]